jgi:fatty acid/phospholipid biosynthesis enzyme
MYPKKKEQHISNTSLIAVDFMATDITNVLLITAICTALNSIKQLQIKLILEQSYIIY